MRKYSDDEENRSGDFDGFKHIQAPVYEKVFWGMLSVRVCVP
jgi:hypothetical protein